MGLKNKGKKLTTERRKLITSIDPKSPISEQYRTVRTNIQFSAVDEEIQTIMVTSAGPAEGKSTTAANLAVTFAQQEKKVLIVDGDLRKPTMHYTLNQTNTFGLTTVLAGQIPLEEAVNPTDVFNLSVLTSGPIPPNPAELMGSKSMERFLKAAKERYDIIIFDTPPILAVTDAQVLANSCDGTVLVVYSGKTEMEEAAKAKELLSATKGKLLGAVLNHKKLENSDYYYYYGNK
ncbi:CpsD/CapB family tyrosine-protein kinase [Mesobacillus maritimus]|uniref:non-specific protein-tyrosine kinase n=1 Tax=Mesobacillus maritimus TaxID=1643336 RepID=A0ABS7K4Y8_9BACI|nr:CpsD/CapB family tyrosine-protein kinase [Mesobacillus maritimus]MBY0097332.1 CpsD/CapB family tyrosine-protein kinase [Mesobacillus maritimus]